MIIQKKKIIISTKEKDFILVHEVNNIHHAYFLFDVQHKMNLNNQHKRYLHQYHIYHNDVMDISNVLKKQKNKRQINNSYQIDLRVGERCRNDCPLTLIHFG